MTKAERMSGVIREVQSICLERDFLAGHFKDFNNACVVQTQRFSTFLPLRNP